MAASLAAVGLLGGACGEAARGTAAAPSAPEAVVPQGARAPRIVAMRWDTLGIPTAEDCPLPDELALVDCRAQDDDGDIQTMVLALEALGEASFSPRYPTIVIRRFPASYGGGPQRIEAPFALRTSGTLPSVRATCEVVDASGLKDTRTRSCGSQ